MGPMRILLWHGYLLGGTGSNVYTRALAREWSRAGHDVTVFAQEPHPDLYDLGGARVVRPDIGGLLPTFVLDEYEGLEAKLVQDFTAEERERYVAANAAALREHLPADLVFANHVILGGPVAAASGARFAVKAHGSELEYAMRGNEELSAWGRESLERAEAVFVGSEHTREVLDEVVGHVDRVHVVPPGVDVELFAPLPRDEALRDLLAESRADPPNPGNANERLPDEGNAERLEAFFAGDEPKVLYFGKLLAQQGRPRPLRGAPRPRRAGRRRRLRRLPRRAGGARPARHALHRRARAPAPREAGPAHRRDRRPVDLPGGLRHGRGRGGRRGIAAARRASLGPRRDRCRASPPSIRSPTATSSASRPATRPTSPTSSDGCSPSTRKSVRSSPQPPGARSSSAGAGRASPNACSSPSTNLSPWRRRAS